MSRPAMNPRLSASPEIRAERAAARQGQNGRRLTLLRRIHGKAQCIAL